mmetsp:Transcript_15499/g.50960  ORF Transcript_15499/g.50960 Transcript_15499/m.50960 type:complete len:230 (-) Transcript_15499:43-732(-)
MSLSTGRRRHGRRGACSQLIRMRCGSRRVTGSTRLGVASTPLTLLPKQFCRRRCTAGSSGAFAMRVENRRGSSVGGPSAPSPSSITTTLEGRWRTTKRAMGKATGVSLRRIAAWATRTFSRTPASQVCSLRICSTTAAPPKPPSKASSRRRCARSLALGARQESARARPCASLRQRLTSTSRSARAIAESSYASSGRATTSAQRSRRRAADGSSPRAAKITPSLAAQSR